MNILHYSLGFPPFRRGGMTQYCLDLMIEQAKVGHQVGLLWPGRLYDLTPKSKVNQKQKYKLQNDLYCTSYELLNPLPIPLMDGIQDPAMYLIKKEKKVYTEFFQKHTFQVLHIHTFMGLPSELVEAAHEVGVKTVFTTHDYFPICPRCNLFHSGKDCQDDKKCSDCVSCNQYGLSFNKMKLFQSELYKSVKESSVIKMLRARHNRKMYDATEQVIESEIIDAKKQKEYQNLRDRNIKLLEKMDVVHFNSTNTLCNYKKRGYAGDNAKVISISNGAIADHKRIRKVGSPVRFGYLGPLTTHKGYNLFKNACDALCASKTIGSNLDDLFEQAKKRQKQNPGTQYLGTVLQHLTAAKLCLILPEGSFEIHGASVADAPTARSGDFVINKTIIHCTTSVGDLLINKCKTNINNGYRPVIITIFERVQTALNQIEDAGLAGRVEVWDIQQFLSSNVYEHSLFDEDKRNAKLGAIIDNYNQIVLEKETDPSLRIEFEAR